MEQSSMLANTTDTNYISMNFVVRLKNRFEDIRK